MNVSEAEDSDPQGLEGVVPPGDPAPGSFPVAVGGAAEGLDCL